MAENILDAARREYAGVAGAVPRGLPQTQAQDSGGGAADVLSNARQWYTGANRTSTANGWDTPFMQEMFAQRDAAAQRGDLGSITERSDFTGIVTYDTPTRRFGDVVQGGQYLGNLYEVYGAPVADTLMADLTLTATAKARAFEAGPQALARAVQEQRAATERDVASYLTAKDFEQESQQRTDELQQGSADDWGIALAGAGGGAATGAGIGAAVGSIIPGIGTAVVAGIGAGVGAIAGGIGAWLNRDELTAQAARAQLVQEQATQRFGDAAGFAAGLEGYSSLAGKAINPVGNLYRGIYDATQGEGGDGEAEWYATDVQGQPLRTGLATGTDIALGLVDAIGQFANPVAQALYLTTMTGSIIGKVGTESLSGGYAFNDRSGSFEDFVHDDEGNLDVGSLLAGVGEVGIDLVQLGGGAALGARSGTAVRDLGATVGTPAGPLKGWGDLVARVEVAAGARGMRFDAGRTAADVARVRTEAGFVYGLDAAGNAIGRRMTLQVLAPSEAVQALTVGAMGRRAAAVRDGAVSANDFFTAANSLAAGDRAWTAALVNGFGEGSEELIQGILEPVMFDASINPYELFEASIRGMVSGVGMSLGASAVGVNADTKLAAQAFVTQSALTGKALDWDSFRADWKKMTDQQKVAAAQAPPWLKQMSTTAAEHIARQQQRTLVATTAGVEKLRDAANRAQMSRLERATDRTDTPFVITQLADAEALPGHAFTASFPTVLTLISKNNQGLQIAADSERLEPQTRANAAAALAAGTRLLAYLRSQGEAYRVASLSGDRVSAAAAIDAANAEIERAFGMDPAVADPAERLAQARAATITLARDPHTIPGSYQFLMPQIDRELTETRSNSVLQVSHAILQATGGDFDGDMLRQLAQLTLDDNAFADVRTGMNLLGAGGKDAVSVNIASYPYEAAEIEELSQTLRVGNAALKGAAVRALSNIQQAFEARYVGSDPANPTVIPLQDLREAIHGFHLAVRSGRTDAREVLMSTMAERFGNALSEFSRGRLTNEWFWMNRVVQRELQRFQRTAASHRATTTDPDVNSPDAPTRDFEPTREVRAKRAATLSATLGLRAAGFSLFRMFQKLHYASWNSAVQGANPLGNTKRLAELTALYEALGQGMTRTELDELDAKDEITAKVLAGLMRLVRSLAQEEGDNSLLTLSLPMVAATKMWDQAPDGSVITGNLAQILLLRVVAQDRKDKAAVATPEMESRWRRLETLGKSPDQASAALIEVLGAVPLYHLIGAAADTLGPDLTLEQALRAMMPLSEEQKQTLKRQRRLEPEYLGRKGAVNPPYGLHEARSGEVSGYRVIVDALSEVASKRLTITADGLSAGEMGDAPGGRSAQYTEALTVGFTQAREALTQLGRLRRRDLSSPEQIAAAMQRIPDLDRAVLNLIPDSAANAVFEIVNGKQMISRWVYEMLAMEPAAAAMHLWRNELLTSWVAAGGREAVEQQDEAAVRSYDTLTRRMHQLMYRLAKANDGGIRQAKFIARLGEATDLNEFMRFVNTELRGDEAPYVAWFDDTADFDVDKAGGGLTAVADGAEMREQILNFRNAARRTLATVQDEIAIERADDDVIMELRTALRDPSAPDSARKRLRRLEAAIAEAQHRMTAMGPNAMLYLVSAAVAGFYGQAHTKGKSPKPYVTPGQVQILGDSFRYATGLERYLAALHTQDLADVASNMALLARDDVRLMDDEGRTINWERLTPERVVELWLERPETHSVLRAILFPAVWERTPEGRPVQQFLVGKSMADLLGRRAYSQLFAKGRAGTMAYASMNDALAGGSESTFSLTRAATDLAIARTSAANRVLDDGEQLDLATEAYQDVVQVVRMAAELLSMNATLNGPSEAMVDEINALRASLRERTRAHRIATMLGVKDPNEFELVDLMIEDAFRDYEANLLLNVPKNDLPALEAAQAEIEATRRRLEMLQRSNPFEEVRAQFALPADGPTRAAKIVELTDYVRYNPSLLTKASWAAEPLHLLMQRMTDSGAERDAYDNIVLASDPSTNDEMWDTISRAVIATYLDDLASFSSDEISVPEFPSADKQRKIRSWDPTFVYLVDDLLDPEGPILTAALQMHLRAERGQRGASMAKLASLVERTVLDPKRLGPWTSDIPRITNEAHARLDAAAAGEAIAASGLAVVRQATIAAATQRTYKKPDPALLSRQTLTLADLDAEPQTPLPVTVKLPGGGTVAMEMPLAMLNGRFAADVQVTYVDPDTGVTTPLTDLWSRRTPEIARIHASEPSVAASGYRSLSVRRLRRALELVLPDNVDRSTVNITVDYFHPASQPSSPDYAHNIYFQGAVFETAADHFRSLNSTLWFTDGGVSAGTQTAALQSNKSGSAAVRATRIPKSGDPDGRIQLESGWETDLNAVITAKAMAPIINDTGVGRIKPTFFNALYQGESLRHFVRGFQMENGQLTLVDGRPVPVLWTAQQVIEFQLANPNTALPLHKAELWVPSEGVLRAMLGEVGGQATSRVVAQPTTFDPSAIPAWNGTTTVLAERMPAILEYDLDTLEFASADLFDSRAVGLSFQTRSTVRQIPDPKAARTYTSAMQIADKLRSVIYAARAEVSGRPGLKSGEREKLLDALRQPSDALDLRAYGLPFLPGGDPGYITEHLLAELLATLNLTPHQALWVYREGPADAKDNLVSGVLNQINLEQDGRKSPKHLWTAPDDIVVVDVSQFLDWVDDKQRFATAARRLDYFMGRRMTVVLNPGQSGRDLSAEMAEYLLESGYHALPGSDRIFVPRPPGVHQQNQAARISTLTEVEKISAESYILNLLTLNKAIAENAAVRVDQGTGRYIAQTIDLLPVNAFGQFNVPRSPLSVTVAKRRLDGILRDPSHLYALLGLDLTKPADKAAADQVLKDLKVSVENFDGDTVLPKRMTQFGTGSIIPLIGPNGEILLYRHGHEAPRPRELREQLKLGGGNLAVYGQQLNPMHTAHRGYLRAISLHREYGLTAKIDVPLQSFGAKIELEGSGMKYLLTTLSETMLKLPKFPLIRGWGIDLISSWHDAMAKESTLGLVDNFRNAFAFLGVNFIPDLIEAFFNVQYDSLTPLEREKYEGWLNELLQGLETGLPKHDPRTIHALMRASSLGGRVAADLASLQLAGPAVAAAGDWRTRLFETTLTPQQQIAQAVVLYLMAPTAKVDHVLATNGFSADAEMRTSERMTHLMPPLFIDYFNANAPIDSALRKHLFAKLNRRFSNVAAPQGARQPGYVMRQDFSVVVQNDNAEDDIVGYLQFAEAHPSDANPELSAQAADRARDQKVSPHAAAIAYQAINAQTVWAKDIEKAQRFITGEQLDRITETDSVWRVVNAVPAQDTSWVPWLQLNPAERHYKQLAREAVGLYRRPINTDDWTEEDRNTYKRLRLDIVAAYGLLEKQAGLVDGWIRQQLWRPASDDPQIGEVSASAAIQVAGDLREMATEGYFPTHGGAVPQLHYFDLALLFRAYERNGKFSPRMGPAIQPRAKTWDEWVKTALGIADLELQHIDPATRLEGDGFLHTYIDADPKLGHLPVSRDLLTRQRLMDPETVELLLRQQVDLTRPTLTRDPHQQVILDETPLQAVEAATLSEIMGAQRRQGGYDLKPAPASARAQANERRRRWRAEKDMAVPVQQSPRTFFRRGAQYVEDTSVNNAFLRVAINLRVGMALLNPLLFISAGPETLVRGMLEDAANLLTGDSTGVVGRTLGRLTARYTPEQMASFRRLTSALGTQTKFKAMFYEDIYFHQARLAGVGRIERATARLARAGALTQDPTWGMRGDTLARRYLESVLREVAAAPLTDRNRFSPEYIVAQLSQNPEWVKNNIPNAHAAAMATVANVRSLKATVASLTLRGIYEPLSSNPNLLIGVPFTLGLKLPLMFSTYAMNVTTTLLGLQGLNAVTAMWLDKRNKGLIGRAQAAMAGKPYNPDSDEATFDMKTVLEGVDLSKAIIQSGITHTSLFAFGLMAGGLGLSGEDDEDRRMRRAAAYQGAGYVFDPRDVENDFRNADAVYLDWLPPFLSSYFTVGEGEGARSMAHMHWMLRQFLSPIIGMERFFETGDSRELIWGFEDALGSFPLINSGSWADAVTTFSILDSAAKTEQLEDNEEGTAAAYGFMLNGVMQLEKMLLENSFVNMVYVGVDDYDRDPWKLPLVSGTGETQVDKLGLPRPTTALQTFVNEQGQVQEGYVNRAPGEAALYGYAENRASFALLMSLFTGQPNLDSGYFRQNMVPKTRTIEKYELTQDQAEALILSVWDEEIGAEVLSSAGAKAVVQGLWKGTVAFDSPALEGVYVPFEMRQAIQRDWMAELIQEGVDAGLTESQAKSRMYRIWYGPSDDPTIPGLKDYLWNDQLSYSRDLRYYQLNTTFVIGPDGQPWATGVQRDGLLNFFGLVPPGFSRYYSGQNGDLPVDGRLNSIDEAAGLNTGLRALQKVNESWNIPTEEEIGKAIEDAISEAMNGSYTPSTFNPYGYGNGFRRFGRGGGGRGGGGGGSFTRLQAPVRSVIPYGQTIPFLNTSTPIIRRGTVRRERFTSTRGRLNQWQ